MKISCFLLVVIFASCTQPRENGGGPLAEKAMENGYLAHEGFTRSMSFVHDWLEQADPKTRLIPRNLSDSKDYWNAKDAAADNYPFMVLTAAVLDRDLYEGRMREMLETEIALTSRWDRLPDTYYFSKEAFQEGEMNKDEIIFGASEYVKDGLLPLTEYIGETAWSKRMIGILDDIWKHAEYETEFGNIPSLNVEVNGELLQVLSRVYWMTGEDKYLEWAKRLGDYYLLGAHHPTQNFEILRLRDHGCEIVSGLCELYLATAYADTVKKQAYQPQIYKMLDRILEVGTNDHGLFYNQINPQTGEVLDGGIADTWGYTYNAFYGVFMVDQHEPYRTALLTALGNLDKYEYFDWERGSADGYADAIESALNLYNREKSEGVSDWIEGQIQVMWSMQDSAHRDQTEQFRNMGIIEGWHGDGNFARTTMMFCLWKTQGTTVLPWKENLYFGAAPDKNGIQLALLSEADWEGKIKFDHPRHQAIFNLPLDYPRINQYPEWFVVVPEKNYRVEFYSGEADRLFTGKELLDGIQLKIEKDQQINLSVYPVEMEK
ncbi:MAG: hypothetical protein WD398_05265 [Cyclobacteriaceae bacterium]